MAPIPRQSTKYSWTFMRILCSVVLVAAATGLQRQDVGISHPRPQLWVKRPGAGTTVELVESLKEVCEAHDLNESAMEAVIRGEAATHRGWQCGTAELYLSRVDSHDEAQGEETAPPHEESQGKKTAQELQTPTPLPLNKMIIQFGASTIAVQIMKRCKDSPNFLMGLRLVYYMSVAVRLLSHALISWRITSTNDNSLVKRKHQDPLSAMLAGLTGKANEPPATAAAYDSAQLRSLRSSYQLGAVVVFLIHLQFKWNQTLVYSAVTSLVDLFFHPLFQIHLLCKEATGALARPYGSGSPDMGALFKAAAAKSAAQ
mmetsp:Transcript_23126/g.38255  ORF Transcript_23126/g.38255 Transcript_23126/m.38255 type:complete len:315 (+) Transcript_23126:128-1072(+)|eukprot:CAMPEP_0119310198 /NCGR_PEP_ID=MMETSP1333-20130426/18038_1 /TAXON_ID=418940 /ORGANISM="Scyphosphaera apsteinii, Strain RCC1455" /LENGTH=314 /DNA_ID=CAMNT_0007314337 /DNA_START=121 /DNA_END=1065 /DNA_ORIENTATION=-